MKEVSKYWWQDRSWRIVQTNMSEIDLCDITAKQYVASLREFNANTVIINTGGIVANYDTKFPFHFKNKFLTGDSLNEVISACQKEGIRVFSRVDFSKVRTPVYENYPDWAYVSPKGNIINYFGDIHVCFNSEYQQKHAIEIMREIIRDLNPDGFFINMGTYLAAFDYTNGWQGICQCENCQRRFFEMYGEKLPVIENENDPVYQKYTEFMRKTIEEYFANINKMFAEEKPDICFAPMNDLFREEVGTQMEWQGYNYHYKSSEVVKRIKTSNPDKVASATSVGFIDMMYRYSSVSPYQHELRIAQSLANGGTADLYMCGRLDTQRDKSGYSSLQKMFKYHKDNEEDYRCIVSNAEIALVKPGFDFNNFTSGHDIKDYQGWYNMLSQHHYLFDCLDFSHLTKVPLEKYKAIIFPDIKKISTDAAEKIDSFVKDGGTIICCGTTGFYNSRNIRYQNPCLTSLGISRVGKITNDIKAAYFEFTSKQGFKRFDNNELVYLHGTYIYAYYADGVKKYLRLIPPHRFAPAESAYHTSVTDYPAFTVNEFGKGSAVYIPWTPGKEYSEFGFPNMDDFMSDLLENIIGFKPVETNAPPMVEVTSTRKTDGSASYVHIVNNTGLFQNSYFNPNSIYNIFVALPCDKKPISVKSMVSGKECAHEFKDNKLFIYTDNLSLFDAFKIV